MRKGIVKKTIYSNILKPGRFIKRTLIFSSLGSMLIGILALLGYIPGLRFLGSGSMGPDYYPMAPSTAISFLLLSIIMIIYILGFLRSRARFFVTLIPAVVSIYGFIKLIEYYAKVGVSFEESIINIPGEIGGMPIGFMSPPTGALFFISGIVIILLIFQATGKKYTNFIGHLMGVLGSMVVLGGLTFIMSYLYGQPFLYNPGNIAPMALTTAIAFLFLGIALVNATGKDYFPLIFFTGTSTRCRLLRIFVPLVVLIVLVQDILSKLIQNVFVINDAIIMGLWIICFASIAGLIIFRFGYSTGTSLDKANEETKNSYIKVKKTLEDMVETLASIVEIKDPYTAGHQKRVAEISIAIAKELGLSSKNIYAVKNASLIHDIGKINIPQSILAKPGKISDLEFSMIKAHPQFSFDIICKIEFESNIAKIVLQHHERLDGSGYPNGLKEKDITPEAKIIAVADVVEAMSSHRPHRPALGIDKAIGELVKNKGKKYDPKVVDSCVKLFRNNDFILKNNNF